MLNRTEEMLDSYVKAPPDKGDGYVALLEVFHQIHCLVSQAISFFPSHDKLLLQHRLTWHFSILGPHPAVHLVVDG
jgi:hypothetical protein